MRLCLKNIYIPGWGTQCQLCWSLRHEDRFQLHWWYSLNLDSVVPREMGISEEDKPLQAKPRWTICLILLLTFSAPKQYIIHSNQSEKIMKTFLSFFFLLYYLVEEESVALKCWIRKMRSQRERLSHVRDGIRQSLSRVNSAVTRSFGQSF